MTEPRFVVGIDLGTSNTAVVYADLHQANPSLEVFEIPQLVRPGDVQERPLLASAAYTPAPFEVEPADLRLPWDDDSKQRDLVVGQAALYLGGQTPVRLTDSSKSWLCHGGVQRRSSILPWQAPDEVKKRSPVDIASELLRHIRAAWNHAFAEPMEAQSILITVPASFDEVARRLTLEAASKAGLQDVHLIEEPVSAFYAYIARTGGTSSATGLQGGERVLIADVGGGTTDFTLIEVSAPKDPEAPLEFERTGVGDHLLLGGDNMDLALAHAVEGTFGLTKQRLDAGQWAQLRLECRLAKETLFSHPEKDKLPITVTGRGQRLVGGTLRSEIDQTLLERSLVEGYFPKLPPGQDALPERRRTGFSEYGLPYASDPRITRHLAAFLIRQAEEGQTFAPVQAVLFNGGALKPTSIRDRICRILGQWMRESGGNESDPRPLIWDEGEAALELSVARGAAYFGLVRAGRGLRVGGGSPHEYFLGLGAAEGEVVPDGKRKLICIAPRGMQDGQTLEVPKREFQLLTNRPVSFPLFATANPRRDPVGSLVTLFEEELHELPPLETVIKFGKQKAGTPVPVRIQVTRTELGTLELSCLSKMSGARFKLEFDLRAEKAASPFAEKASSEIAQAAEQVFATEARKPPEEGEVSPSQLEKAKARILRTFSELPNERPTGLMKGLESDLERNRDSIPLSALRALSEVVLEQTEHRGLNPELESRWLNTIGFLLRPGFGLNLDEWRVKQLWKIHGQGPFHPGAADVQLSWWILWRRVAGGLSRGPQDELSSRLFPLLIPALHKRAKRKPPKPQTQEAAEMWRAASALEQISAKQRTQLGHALIELIESRKAPKGALWCLGRLGARKLLYGPRESTIKPATAETWLERLFAASKLPKGESPVAAVLSIARLTGDRQLDLQEQVRKKADGFLEENGVPETIRQALFQVVEVDRRTQADAFGDALPTGLSLVGG